VRKYLLWENLVGLRLLHHLELGSFFLAIQETASPAEQTDHVAFWVLCLSYLFCRWKGGEWYVRCDIFYALLQVLVSNSFLEIVFGLSTSGIHFIFRIYVSQVSGV
jgi:hypothetical protein